VKEKIYCSEKQFRALNRDAMVAFLLKVVGTLLGFAVNVVVARLLGIEGSGLYFLSLAVITVATVIGMFGLGTTGLRFIAASCGEGEWGKAKNVSIVVTSLALAILVCCSVLTMYLSEPIARELFSRPELVQLIFWMSLGIAPFGFFQLMAEQLRGIGKILPALSLQSIYLPLLTILALVVLASPYGVLGVVWSFLFASWITAIIAAWYWVQWMGGYSREKERITRSIAESCLPMLISEIATKVVIPWAPILLLGVLATTSEVGQYAMASRVAMLASFLLLAVNIAVAPRFASMFRKGEIVQLEEMARHSTIMLTAVAAPVTLLIILLAEPIMGVFGGEFKVGAATLVILSLGQFVNAATGSVGYLLAMSGNEVLYQRITVGAMLLLLGLSIVLIPEMGSLGAAISVAVTVSIQNLLLAWAVYARLKISVFWFLKRRQCEPV